MTSKISVIESKESLINGASKTDSPSACHALPVLEKLFKTVLNENYDVYQSLREKVGGTGGRLCQSLLSVGAVIRDQAQLVHQLSERLEEIDPGIASSLRVIASDLRHEHEDFQELFKEHNVARQTDISSSVFRLELLAAAIAPTAICLQLAEAFNYSSSAALGAGSVITGALLAGWFLWPRGK